VTCCGRKFSDQILGGIVFTPAGNSVQVFAVAAARYFLLPRDDIVAELGERERSCTSELERLKGSRTALEKGATAVEGELRELLKSSPALARALYKQ